MKNSSLKAGGRLKQWSLKASFILPTNTTENNEFETLTSNSKYFMFDGCFFNDRHAARYPQERETHRSVKSASAGLIGLLPGLPWVEEDVSCCSCKTGGPSRTNCSLRFFDRLSLLARRWLQLRQGQFQVTCEGFLSFLAIVLPRLYLLAVQPWVKKHTEESLLSWPNTRHKTHVFHESCWTCGLFCFWFQQRLTFASIQEPFRFPFPKSTSLKISQISEPQGQYSFESWCPVSCYLAIHK